MLDGLQAEPVGIELRDRARRGDAPQPPVERIGPGVIGAGDHPPAPMRALRHDGMRPVPAHIVEDADLTVLAANGEDPATEQIEPIAAALLWQLAAMAEHVPGAPVDALQLRPEH